MKYNKLMLFLAMSCLILGNTKVVAMVPHKTATTTKKTSFLTLYQLFFNSSVINEIQEKTTEILTKTRSLQDPISEDQVNEIITLWNYLTQLHVSNGLERCFNWYGPVLDDLSPLKRKLSLLCHSDKYPNNDQRLEIFKSLELVPRENPILKELNNYTTAAIADKINTKLYEGGNFLINAMYRNQSMLDHKTMHEINKSYTKMKCNSHIQDSKNLKYFYTKK